MGLPVTVYRFDDAGAPQLPSGSVPKMSEIIAILKACLIDGYGTKPALGWTMPFSDDVTLKYVFRNSPTDGSGGAVQMEDSSGNAETNGAPIICQFGTSITGLDSIINPSYKHSFNMSSYNDWKEWVLIGTTTGFYFIWNRDGAKTSGRNLSTNGVLFCGDIESYTPSDNGRFICCINTAYNGDSVNGSTNYAWSFTHAFLNPTTYTSSGCLKIIGTDGSTDAVDYGLMAPSSPLIASASDYQYTGNDTGVYDRVYISVKSVPSNAYNLLAPDGKPYITSEVHPRVRGHLPGFIIEISPTYNSEMPWPHVAMKAGKNHMAVPVAHQPNAFWINMEEW